MYREDLDQLLELLKGKCTRVTISDKRYRYDSFDEMKRHSGSRVHNLEIHGEQPGLHFFLNQSEHTQGYDPSITIMFNELRAEEATEEADALFFKVKDFLSSHQQPQVRPRFVLFAIVAFVGMLMLSILNREAIMISVDRVAWWFVAVLLVGVPTSLGSLLMAFRIGNYLTLETRLDSPSFWARHQDAFATHAVTAAISAVVGGIVGWLVGHFLK
jgi:hypothetical protein